MKQMKKKYERPKLELFELKQHPQLLAGSEANAGVQNYDLEDKEDW